ncbi:IS982 family transposase [Limosilactobacillus reuteri]|uniref:IS982 family transposase n=1 Tax=Limosilactobacillus reuteri TaxID=1598 RepID=A0AAW4X4Q9_LIMRT|nr:IS982 family transposase [Limosilactobacillus reuteri]MCC4477491.1 IS982 family transposase [Limosilactobacillus reuteri]MCC4477546.1 IS982 family transposase [Limosilactobacillus reuteri]MCC4477567.1 IS982 family transposase [Limosilactobacillus reuteri]MCC4477587.1 IS982 family transposase [Limosilactobacillus reuteri]
MNYFKCNQDLTEFQEKFNRWHNGIIELIRTFASKKFIDRRNVDNTKPDDASIITLMCFRSIYNITTLRKLHQIALETLGKNQISCYSGFTRRCKHLRKLLQIIRRGLLSLTTITETAIIDSYPLALCQPIRNHRASLFAGKANIGYNATKQVYFYGFKVHVLTDLHGVILNYEVAPASIHDVKVAPELLETCPCPYVLGDVGYLSKQLRQNLARVGVELWTPFRSNMKGAQEHNDPTLKRLRRRIETTFSQLTLGGGETSYSRSLGGLQAKLEALFLTHNLLKLGF